jgi:SulP family sulfate permease
MAAIIAGLLLVPLILLVAPLTAYLPKATVAALLVLVAWRLIDMTQIKLMFTADHKEAGIMGVTFLSTIFFKLEFAILFGVILSLMIFLRKTSRPRIMPRVPDPGSKNRKFISGITMPECPQLKILRLDDSIYFGSVAHIGDLLRLYREHYPGQKHLLLLTKGVNQVDISGAELLLNETRKRRMMDGDFYMYRLKDSASKVLRDGGYLDYIGEHNIFSSKEEAIEQIFDKLDKDICASCENRIFRECASIPVAVPALTSPAEPQTPETADAEALRKTTKKKVKKKAASRKKIAKEKQSATAKIPVLKKNSTRKKAAKVKESAVEKKSVSEEKSEKS